ncbi:MAG: hypothetical protein ABIZ34_03050 [Candidatus Limnocylindrales bacterium]
MTDQRPLPPRGMDDGDVPELDVDSLGSDGAGIGESLRPTTADLGDTVTDVPPDQSRDAARDHERQPG